MNPKRNLKIELHEASIALCEGIFSFPTTTTTSLISLKESWMQRKRCTKPTLIGVILSKSCAMYFQLFGHRRRLLLFPVCRLQLQSYLLDTVILVLSLLDVVLRQKFL